MCRLYEPSRSDVLFQNQAMVLTRTWEVKLCCVQWPEGWMMDLSITAASSCVLHFFPHHHISYTEPAKRFSSQHVGVCV